MALTLWVGAHCANFKYVDPILQFNGTTATCAIDVKVDDGVKFNATMTFYRVEGSKDVLLKEWGTSATTSLEHEGTRNGLISGETYKLTVRASANGETVTKSVTATCP